MSKHFRVTYIILPRNYAFNAVRKKDSLEYRRARVIDIKLS